jgi:hypothetical protein
VGAPPEDPRAGIGLERRLPALRSPLAGLVAAVRHLTVAPFLVQLIHRALLSFLA